MCGIAGIVNYNDVDLNGVLQLLHHRGPDDQTIYRDSNIALLHTRLAIQDIQQGVQPFHFQHYSIVFNGEIYNHLALRQKLSDFNFKTQSDTETLLYLFIKYQYEMFDLLDGMFAFCILDKKNNKLILARDRAGKKPLYYYLEKQSFVFSSELRVIQYLKKPVISDEAINCYLRAGFIAKPYTPYQNVFELESGHYATVDINTFKFENRRYFNFYDCFQRKSTRSLPENVHQLDQLLTKSISDRMTSSDVEVGVFLSGGIDSNLIAAIASKTKPNLKTFTVKLDGLYDESRLAKLTAEKYQTNHIELSISNDLQQDIESILQSYGEPFMDSSAIPSFYVSREARRHVKVVLGGDGADELFAGYRRYVPFAHSMTKYLKWASPVARCMPSPQKKQSLCNYFYRLLRLLSKKGLDFYLSATTDVFEDVHAIGSNSILSTMNETMLQILSDTSLSRLDQFLYLDFTNLLFCDLLVKMDIASMANSLEVRSPFLSKYMLEFAATLPDALKIRGTTTKFLLRQLAQQYLPAELIRQPKRGFEVPLKKWVDDDLRDNIFDRLKPGCYAEKFVSRSFIDVLKTGKINTSSEKRAKMLWSLYCLEVWHDSI